MSSIIQKNITSKDEYIVLSEYSRGEYRSRDITSLLLCNISSEVAIVSLYVALSDELVSDTNVIAYNKRIEVGDTWYWNDTDGLRVPSGYTLYLKVDKSMSSVNLVATTIMQ